MAIEVREGCRRGARKRRSAGGEHEVGNVEVGEGLEDGSSASSTEASTLPGAMQSGASGGIC